MAAVLLTVLFALIVAPLCVAFNAFVVMIGMGMLHSVFASVPAIGFWPSVVVSLAVSLHHGSGPVAIEITPENWGTVQVSRGGIDLFARLLTAMGCKVTRHMRRQYVFTKRRGKGWTKAGKRLINA